MAKFDLSFKLKSALSPFYDRQVFGQPSIDFLKREIGKENIQSEWQITLGENLLFDREGLKLIKKALFQYTGKAKSLGFRLRVDPDTLRDYYSFLFADSQNGDFALPITAERDQGIGAELITIALPCVKNWIPFPRALAEASWSSLPTAILLPFICDFDLLFFHQMLLINCIRRQVKSDFLAWIKGALKRGSSPLSLKIALASKTIHPKAEVHPTAIVEGSIVEAGARIGAFCVVRFSYIAKKARLHDGAKVEFSYVGTGTWLMHDLVLYRSYTENDVFLIHGPYQFSGFQSGSSAFATIMMDYRPDGKPIRILGHSHPLEYKGRFLGAILQVGSKTLGGCLLAPGQIVAANRWLTSDLDSIHRGPFEHLPERKALPPTKMNLDIQLK